MLGEDLIMSIWSILSIKSTVRFQCVSKSWCASLSDPHFIFKNLTAANEHDLLLLTDRECQHYYSIVSHEATTLMATPLQVSPEIPVPLTTPHTPHPVSSVLSPPCHDMVCFHILDYCYRVHSMGVWNLTTGETKTVPLLDMDSTFTIGFTTIGFGFDEKRKEYKIVLIVCLGPDKFEAYVYSLSSNDNCWRKVGEPKMLYRYGTWRNYSRSYKDGTFYWGSGDLIMSFDMSSEVFKPISVSVQVEVGRSPYIRQICMLKEGSMIMIMDEVSDNGKHTLEYQIWALLDVGVNQSWTKLSVIDWDWGREEGDVPLGFWRNELVLRSRRLKPNCRLFVIDPFKREIKKIHTDEPYGITWCFAWTKKREEQFVEV